MRLVASPHRSSLDLGLLFGILAFVMLGAARVFPIQLFSPPCLFHEMAGIPCPTCGATRALIHLAHGDLEASFVMNPLTAVCIGGAAVVLLFSLVRLLFAVPRFELQLSGRESSGLRTAIVVIVMVQWIYLIIVGR